MAAVTDQMAAPGAPAIRRTPKGTFDIVFRNASRAAALFVLVLLAGIIASMIIGGWPAFREFGLGFITSSVWDTQNEQYGAWPAIVGTWSPRRFALALGGPLPPATAVSLPPPAPPGFKRPFPTTMGLPAA